MSLIVKILEDLWYAELNYKGMKVNGFGIPKDLAGYRERTVINAISKLKRNGMIAHAQEGWVLTSEGKKYYEKRVSLKQFESPFSKAAPKNLIVMFDIPEANRQQRDWFRNHLQKFGYAMIQKSVWVGPSPLPQEFTKYLGSIGMKSAIKSFKLAKPYKK